MQKYEKIEKIGTGNYGTITLVNRKEDSKVNFNLFFFSFSVSKLQ